MDEDQKDRALRAARGWLGEPPSQLNRTPASHQRKWHLMMGGTPLPSEIVGLTSYWRDKDEAKARADAANPKNEEN